MAGPWEAYQASGPWAAFQPQPAAPAVQAQQPEPNGPLENAVAPIANLPSDYNQLRNEGADQMARGVDQLKSGINFATSKTPEGMSPADQAGAGPVSLVKGIGNVIGGAAGYIASPITAATRSLVGRPVENVTGVPKEYTEFAAGMALPIPNKLPRLPARSPAAIKPTTEALFDAADQGYAAQRGAKATVAPEEVRGLSQQVQTDLKQAGSRDYLEPKTHRAIGELKVDEPSDFNDLYGVRKVLNRAARDPQEGMAARDAIRNIDDFIEQRFAGTAEARGNYAKAKQAEQLETAVERASRAAGAANSGQNFENALRAQIKTIRNSPKLSAGYSENALSNMDELIKGSTAANLFRGAGNALGGGGGLASTVVAKVLGPAAPVIGYGLKKASSALTSNQMSKLIELVQSEAPAAKATSASFRQWSEAHQAFEADPSVKAFVRMSVASRNLANNLKPIGIEVAPNSLIKLQSPVGGRAEGDQQDVPGVLPE